MNDEALQRPYRPSLRDQIANGWDAYLSITRNVQRRLDGVLGRDTQNWRALNSCPCCHYEVRHIYSRCISTDSLKLVDEPQLKYRKITILDGNTSLRRVDRHESASKHIFRSDYFLSVDKVNEVMKQDASRQVSFLHGPSVNPLLTPDVEGDGFGEAVEDGNAEHCVRNWRAALPDNLKSMFSKFDETGIFVAVCRHGFISTCVDMVRSGEL